MTDGCWIDLRLFSGRVTLSGTGETNPRRVCDNPVTSAKGRLARRKCVIREARGLCKKSPVADKETSFQALTPT
jgi:hypothetical protein